ncbi:MAG: heavy-metal-associated domain-containing protein [Armatimonadota bacterium]|nr:heavy-metal-associated domain-containing protein [Armatimonadota bacterium]MDR5696643.1 heavy-metal-associated domain-containing protein [Armatimonadota bacterium]
MERVYKVPRIHCGGCVATVEETASSLPGVIRVRADENSKEVRVEFDPQQIDEERIKQALADVGYPVAV